MARPAMARPAKKFLSWIIHFLLGCALPLGAYQATQSPLAFFLIGLGVYAFGGLWEWWIQEKVARWTHRLWWEGKWPWHRWDPAPSFFEFSGWPFGWFAAAGILAWWL